MSRFQVDLSGMVDLLSRHLYSGPQVFVRELLQNGVDAVTARRLVDPAAPGQIEVTVHGDGLAVHDTGSGLTAAEAEEMLATIGRSSKRDPQLGLARSDYIGQFGIGMLAAFMVSSRIEVLSRSAREPETAIRWIGHDNGTFEIHPLQDDAELPEPGTIVKLAARPDMASWLSHQTVLSLAREYGEFLPIPITVATEGEQPVVISRPELPWQRRYPSGVARAAALSEYCEQTFGFTPLGSIDLDVSLAGVSGVAFILPQAVTAGSNAHRVYVKRMLLSPRTENLVPEWAFFVRIVADTTLSPTASREALHDDEILEATREALGGQLRGWVQRTLGTGSALAQRFLTTHHLALRSLAIGDDEVLDLVARVLPYETTDGAMTLAEASRAGELVYTTTTEAYRRIEQVARAQGLVVVNAGYVYDADILARLAARGWRTRELGESDLVQSFQALTDARENEIAAATHAARQIMQDEDCDVLVRCFEPSSVPAVLLRDRESEFQRDLGEQIEQHDDAWGDLLGSFVQPTEHATRSLVLNDSSEVVQHLWHANQDVFAAGLRSVYFSALMLAGDGLRAREVQSMNEALSVLLSASMKGIPG